MNTKIDLVKLKEYRDELFKESHKQNFTIPRKYDEAYYYLFDHIFQLGQFVGVNMILHNPDFQKKEVEENE